MKIKLNTSRDTIKINRSYLYIQPFLTYYKEHSEWTVFDDAIQEDLENVIYVKIFENIAFDFSTIHLWPTTI